MNNQNTANSETQNTDQTKTKMESPENYKYAYRAEHRLRMIDLQKLRRHEEEIQFLTEQLEKSNRYAISQETYAWQLEIWAVLLCETAPYDDFMDMRREELLKLQDRHTNTRGQYID